MSPVDQSTSRASPTCSHSTEIHRMRAVKQSDSLVCDLSGAKIETNSRHLTNSHLACKNISKMQLISALQHANSAPQDVEWCQQEEIGCFVWFGLEWVGMGWSGLGWDVNPFRKHQPPIVPSGSRIRWFCTKLISGLLRGSWVRVSVALQRCQPPMNCPPVDWDWDCSLNGLSRQLDLNASLRLSKEVRMCVWCMAPSGFQRIMSCPRVFFFRGAGQCPWYYNSNAYFNCISLGRKCI